MSRYLSYYMIIISAVLIVTSCSNLTDKGYPVKPVPFTAVKVEKGFWYPRLETNSRISIPHSFQQCVETGRIDNFDFASGNKEGVHQGYFFNDSDVFKVIEGAAYSLAVFPDPELESYVDEVIEKIAAAQEDDGYIYTARTALNPGKLPPGGEERWSDIRWGHELYCAGHLYEAAVAYYNATGKSTLLDAALKNADLIDSVFGPDKMRYPPGHEEIEIGLVKLYKHTGEEKYLRLAEFFINERGVPEGHGLYDDYSQDHMPVTEQDEAVGHAVRAAYLYSGMADVAVLTGNDDYIKALDKIWNNAAGKKMYITGGIGARGGNEGFDEAYLLPNNRAYSETCASIANAMWNHRMFLIHGESKYMDIVERVIYNSFLSGVGMKGDRFFYPNRLQTFNGEERSPWFNCACCPSNIVRFIPSVLGYIYAHRGDDLYVNLFIDSRAEITMDKRNVSITQETDYPWSGRIRITVDPEYNDDKFTMNIRIPGWAQNRPVPTDLYTYLGETDEKVSFRINGKSLEPIFVDGYAWLQRSWNKGDIIEVDIPMPVRRVRANGNVEDDMGKTALESGPIVFAVEGHDIEGGLVRDFLLPDDATLNTEYISNMLGGVQVIKGRGFSLRYGDSKDSVLREEREFTAIPYYSWAHRGRTEMAVWLAREESAAMPSSEPTIASTSRISASFGQNPEAAVDQLEPKNSIDHSVPYYHNWPHKGTTEWIQLDFERPEGISSVEVYWFDDTGIGECRVPESWRILYRDSRRWREIPPLDGYGTAKDRFNKSDFSRVRTGSIRIEMKLKDGFAAGIHEIIIK
ncbi:glycoside hydrolase family 127 protein [candidate division KSB1 bacterium]